MAFALYVVAGPDAGRRYAFVSGATLGRTSESDVIIQDDVASRTHARIYAEGPRYFLEDSGSANGTKLDGRRILEATRLRGGEVISVGAVSIEFELTQRPHDGEPEDEEEDLRATMDTSEAPQGTLYDADASVADLPKHSGEPSLTPSTSATALLEPVEPPEVIVAPHVFTKKEEQTALREPHRPAPKKPSRVGDVVLALFVLAALAATAHWAIPIFREALATP